MKRWCPLFTCLNVRTVHLALANQLNTDSAINAIRRFMARRGKPSRIHSDNGTNFIGANEEIKKAAMEIGDSTDVRNWTANHEIDWHFIPPSAPHMGGC